MLRRAEGLFQLVTVEVSLETLGTDTPKTIEVDIITGK